MTRGQTPRAGRLPDHTGARTVLPREGRQAPAPPWPLPGAPTPREAQLWERAWSRPQALIWERDGLEDLVGLYVRKSAEAEIPASPAAVVETARRLADDLLLTVPAMKRAGVAIREDDTAPARPGAFSAPVATQRRPSARDRFRVVNPTSATEPEDGPA